MDGPEIVLAARVVDQSGANASKSFTAVSA